MPLMAMVHERDPRRELFEKFEPYLADIEVFFSHILVAIYKRPDKTASGLHLPDSTRDEDKYQGKAALILKMGEMAFVDTERVQFGNCRAKVGDWVFLRSSDGLPFQLGTRDGDCRLIQDTSIRGVIARPDMIW